MVTNLETYTLFLHSPDGRQSKHPSYHINCTPANNHIHDFFQALRTKHPHPQESVSNVYELPSIAPTIRYLRGAAGFPVKSTWLATICEPNNAHVTWPLINIKNVINHFPESEETQLGHMRNQHQNVCSTKKPVPAPAASQQDQVTSPCVPQTTPKSNDM